jgi:predicted flap endonuclease-1-like 5' DNA nuclease
VRAASRVARVIVAVVVLVVSVSWLLRHWRPPRSAGERRLTVVPPLDEPPPAEPEPAEPAATELAEPEPAAEPELAGEPEQPTGPAGTVTEQLPPGLPPAGADDDLQRIRGVGPAIESVLHGLGVRTYRQLATLGEADQDRLRVALRDARLRAPADWRSQARELHRVKYGEDLPAGSPGLT